MTTPIIKSGQYEGQPIATVTDKTFLIQYRQKHQQILKGQDKLTIDARIRELHKQTPA